MQQCIHSDNSEKQVSWTWTSSGRRDEPLMSETAFPPRWYRQPFPHRSWICTQGESKQASSMHQAANPTSQTHWLLLHDNPLHRSFANFTPPISPKYKCNAGKDGPLPGLSPWSFTANRAEDLLPDSWVWKPTSWSGSESYCKVRKNQGVSLKSCIQILYHSSSLWLVTFILRKKNQKSFYTKQSFFRRSEFKAVAKVI